jgi:hypothetical protein
MKMEYEIIIRVKQDFPSMQEVLNEMAEINKLFADKYDRFSVEVDVTHIRGATRDG